MLGGARNISFEEEETFSTDVSARVQEELERFLKEIVLPGVAYQVERRWSGTMAIGKEKKPLVQKINERVFCAVRMSGMGVALAPQLGIEISGMMLGPQLFGNEKRGSSRLSYRPKYRWIPYLKG